MIEKKIDEDINVARKAKNDQLKTILVVIKGEIQTMRKNMQVDFLGDVNTQIILNRFAKGLRENMKTVNASNDSDAYELSVIESYLPKMMSDAEIILKVRELVEDGISNIGQIMAFFKGLPVDMKKVSTIFNECKKSI